MLSAYVICWIFLQTFQTYFCIQANSLDPDQTAPRIVVIVSLRANREKWIIYCNGNLPSG